MKTLKAKKTMAAKVLGVGANKVWFDPLRLNEIKEAITKQDIQDLIKDKAIKKKPSLGIKRRAGKERLKRKMKGRRRNEGKIKFKKSDGNYPKRIRKLRSFLKNLKQSNKISKEQNKKIYRLIKAGVLKNKQSILEKSKIK
jgi:large subunit ribosomal protein L19e